MTLDCSARRMAFREWFGLSPAEADVLVALYADKGKPTSLFRLAQQAGVSTGSARLYVHTLRSALDPEALDSERLKGYWLTETGLAECRGALWEMGEELRGAA